MLQNYNKYKVLKVFFDDPLPEGGFMLREISRKAKLATTSVKSYLNELEKDNLISKKKHRLHDYPTYYANIESDDFKLMKKIDNILKLKESGLLEHLKDTCMPTAIILFGSASKGEDTKESDMDIFLLCKEMELDLKKFEFRIGRKINMFFSDRFNKLSEELRNSIINGVILSGYIKAY